MSLEIRIRDIVKNFDGGPGRGALNGVSLDVGGGELMALLGPSGAGKTTLLRIIAGLDAADGGTIHFGTEDASQKSVQERRVGFVFQSYALFKHMTVAENVGFGLKVRGRATRPPRQEIARRVVELLELVQLADYAKRRPNQLSGGQRQRVALARALAVEPKVLLLDEPFGALDAQVRRDLRSWLREFHVRTGHTTIFVTHDQDEALELADRVAVLRRGLIEQVGTPDEIYDRPKTPFVHGFIGEARAIIVDRRQGALFLGAKPLHLPVGSGPAGSGKLFVRPHDVVIGHGGGSIEARIVAVRRTGATRRAEVALPEAAGSLEIDLPSALVLQPGETIPVQFTRGTFYAD